MSTLPTLSSVRHAHIPRIQSSARHRPAGGLFPRERPSLNALRRVPSWNTTPGTPNSETWKPPNIWDYKPPVDIPVTSSDSPNIAA